MTESLRTDGAKQDETFGFADEMRLGLHGQRRKVWFGRGVKLRQRLEMRFVWKWLYLAVDCVAGKIVWNWQGNMKRDSMQASLKVFAEAGFERIVWDNAPSHRAKVLREEGKDLPRLHFLPPFSPELNPAERVFEEVRRHVEGKVWETIEAKVAAVEAYLMALVKDEERTKSLVCWNWIGDAVKRLPEPEANHVASI